jgi:hypothetical protein
MAYTGNINVNNVLKIKEAMGYQVLDYDYGY